MHLAPDALEAEEEVGLTTPFPLAAFFIAFSFFTVFFLHRILAPALRLAPHLHSAYPDATLVRVLSSMPPSACECLRRQSLCAAACARGYQRWYVPSSTGLRRPPLPMSMAPCPRTALAALTSYNVCGQCTGCAPILWPLFVLPPNLLPPRAQGPLPASPENGVAKCGRCGADCRCADGGSQCGRNSNDCGCAGGVSAGGCGTGCQAGGCKCVHRKEGGAGSSSDSEVSATSILWCS